MTAFFRLSEHDNTIETRAQKLWKIYDNQMVILDFFHRVAQYYGTNVHYQM